ncbi:MAG TPA: hypothetical protein PLL53_10580 [Saprospiraceae bacterium]|nr:hypothetical protein [Saprospiraceae bacterium]
MNRIVLNLDDPKKEYKLAVLYFDDHVMFNKGEKVQVINATVTYRLPIDRYLETVDLLRYEEPLFFYASSPLHGTLQDGYLDEAWVQTGEAEPVGEGE